MSNDSDPLDKFALKPHSHASAGATSYLAVGLVVVVTAVAAIGVLELAPGSSTNLSATTSISSIAAGLSSSTQNTTASSPPVSPGPSNGHLPDSCGSAVFPVLPKQENGSIFLKILTDQGSMVRNGSVLVTHSISNGPQVPANRTTYCLRLEPNATGFIELASDGLPQAGVYNLTFAAGYDQGPGTWTSVYLFSVQPNTSIYVTVSVPSRVAQIVTSTTGGGVVTSTTTAVPQ